MLTINHSDVNHVQTLYEATRVEYDPNSCAGTSGKDYEPFTGSVRATCTNAEFDETRYDLVSFYGGRVYVMNSDGKTIATYNLGGWKSGIPASCSPTPTG